LLLTEFRSAATMQGSYLVIVRYILFSHIFRLDLTFDLTHNSKMYLLEFPPDELKWKCLRNFVVGCAVLTYYRCICMYLLYVGMYIQHREAEAEGNDLEQCNNAYLRVCIFVRK